MEMVHFGKDLVCPRQHYQKFEGHRNSFENSIGSFFLPRLCTKPTLGSSLSADQIGKHLNTHASQFQHIYI